MPLYRGTRISLLGGGAPSYIDKVLSYNPIAYWPLNEASGTVAGCRVSPAQNGAYTGVTLGETGIGDGETCPLLDGTTDYVDILSDSLKAAFNGAEHTLLLWLKMYDVDVWEDETWRYGIDLTVDANNYTKITKASTDSRMRGFCSLGGTVEAIDVNGFTSLDWLSFGMTVSKTLDQVRFFSDGSQIGSTATGLGTWAGTLATANIGSASGASSGFHYGWQAHVALFGKALTPAQMAIVGVL